MHFVYNIIQPPNDPHNQYKFTLLEDNDVSLANLVDLDLVHVTRLLGRGRRDPRQWRGANGFAQTAQIPLGHEADDKEIVLVAVVQVQLAHFAARDDHCGTWSSGESEHQFKIQIEE